MLRAVACDVEWDQHCGHSQSHQNLRRECSPPGVIETQVKKQSRWRSGGHGNASFAGFVGRTSRCRLSWPPHASYHILVTIKRPADASAPLVKKEAWARTPT